MGRPWFIVLFCVLIQRAASQASCQSDLYISVDDLLRAINSGQLNLNQGNIGQDVCGCQNTPPPIQNTCGCQNSLNQQQYSIASQPISYGNQIPGSLQSFQANQQSGCGCQQPSIAFANQPSLSIGSQGCQPSISLNQLSCGCNQQPSIPLANQPFPLGNQIFGSQPSISQNQPSCGCGQQSPSQTSIALNNLCGCQPSLSLNQQPSFSIAQPTLSLPSPQTCGSQQSFSANRPSLGLQRGTSNQQCYAQPTFSLNSLSQQPSNQCGCLSQSTNVGNNVVFPNVVNIGSNVASVVPNALLQAPPFGIIFEGENLIIDGGVQVYGSMPFNSAVQVSGVLPTSGIGNVQYVCNDFCQS